MTGTVNDRPATLDEVRPRRAKHLLDLDNPRPRRPDPMNVQQVQRWVMSVLVLTTGVHFSGGVVVAAFFADERVARNGLLVMAGIVGMLSVAGAMAIHRRRLPNLWLLLGLIPSLVGAWLMYGR